MILCLYHDLHGNNDIRARVLTILQMFTVAGMAVFAHNALGESSASFALTCAAIHLIITIMLSLLWTNRNREIQEQLNRVDKT